MMTGASASASALEYCLTTVTDADKPSIEAEPSSSSTPCNIQHLNLPAGDETLNSQSANDIQLASSTEDKERGAIMASAVDMVVQDADGTIERKDGERGGGVEMDEAAELKFMLFPKLPTELRLKIWKHALPGPRVVEIEWSPNTREWFCPFESQSKRSSLSRTNRESREVFHKNYLPTAKISRVVTQQIVQDEPDPFHETSQHTISYFDSTIDILYIGTCSSEVLCITLESFKALAASPWMQKVRLLAIECQEWYESGESGDPDVEMHHEVLSLLPNLTEIILVLGDIHYQSLVSTAECWTSRPRAEIEFIDAEDPSVPPWVEAMASSYNEKFSCGDGLKFSMKEVLRGGVIPESVEHFRSSDSHVSERKEDSDGEEEECEIVNLTTGSESGGDL
jgi:hypothetical protein